MTTLYTQKMTSFYQTLNNERFVPFPANQEEQMRKDLLAPWTAPEVQLSYLQTITTFNRIHADWSQDGNDFPQGLAYRPQTVDVLVCGTLKQY